MHTVKGIASYFFNRKLTCRNITTRQGVPPQCGGFGHKKNRPRCYFGGLPENFRMLIPWVVLPSQEERSPLLS